MTALTAFNERLEDLLTPINRHDNKTAMYGRAAKYTGLSPRRIKGFATGEIRDPRLSDLDAVNAGWSKFIRHNSRMWERIERMRAEAEAAGFEG